MGARECTAACCSGNSTTFEHRLHPDVGLYNAAMEALVAGGAEGGAGASYAGTMLTGEGCFRLLQQQHLWLAAVLSALWPTAEAQATSPMEAAQPPLEDLPVASSELSFPRVTALGVHSFAGADGAAVLRIQRWFRRHPVWASTRACRQGVASPGTAAVLPTGATGTIVCRFGQRCPFLAIGRCRFRHEAVGVDPAPPAQALIESRVLQAGTRGSVIRQLYEQYARRTQCTDVVVHDPYVVSILAGSHLAAAVDRALPEEVAALMADADLSECTGLKFFEEVVQILDRSCAALRHVELVTRGALRHDVPAGALLALWADGFRQRWSSRGVMLAVTLAPRVHARCVVLRGPLTTVEVRAEWGMGTFQDLASNLSLGLDSRVLKRTEILVLETLVVPTVAGSQAPPVHVAINAALLAMEAFQTDLNELGRRFGVCIRPAGRGVTVEGAQFAAAVHELWQLVRWHGGVGRPPVRGGATAAPLPAPVRRRRRPPVLEARQRPHAEQRDREEQRRRVERVAEAPSGGGETSAGGFVGALGADLPSVQGQACSQRGGGLALPQTSGLCGACWRLQVAQARQTQRAHRQQWDVRPPSEDGGHEAAPWEGILEADDDEPGSCIEASCVGSDGEEPLEDELPASVLSSSEEDVRDAAAAQAKEAAEAEKDQQQGTPQQLEQEAAPGTAAAGEVGCQPADPEALGRGGAVPWGSWWVRAQPSQDLMAAGVARCDWPEVDWLGAPLVEAAVLLGLGGVAVGELLRVAGEISRAEAVPELPPVSDDAAFCAAIYATRVAAAAADATGVGEAGGMDHRLLGPPSGPGEPPELSDSGRTLVPPSGRIDEAVAVLAPWRLEEHPEAPGDGPPDADPLPPVPDDDDW